MNTNDDFNRELQINRATAKAALATKGGIDAAGAGANRALSAAAEKLNDFRYDTAPVLGQRIGQAKGWVDEKAGRVRDGVQVARDKANDLSDQVIVYARNEPVKALLIAAVAGAGLMGLLVLIGRSDD